MDFKLCIVVRWDSVIYCGEIRVIQCTLWQYETIFHSYTNRCTHMHVYVYRLRMHICSTWHIQFSHSSIQAHMHVINSFKSLKMHGQIHSGVQTHFCSQFNINTFWNANMEQSWEVLHSIPLKCMGWGSHTTPSSELVDILDVWSACLLICSP